MGPHPAAIVQSTPIRTGSSAGTRNPLRRLTPQCMTSCRANAHASSPSPTTVRSNRWKPAGVFVQFGPSSLEMHVVGLFTASTTNLTGQQEQPGIVGAHPGAHVGDDRSNAGRATTREARQQAPVL